TTIGRMHASSTTEQLRLTYDLESDKYASFTIDTNGDLNIDLATGNSTTTISDNLSVLGYLNIEGNATTSGSQYIKKNLTVDGQCVTGDTLLPIVNSGAAPVARAAPNYTRIDEVQPGDYVLSLNEKTGELTPAKIKQLMDMGVKTIYEIETEDGRTIRTTGNHPYLARPDLVGLLGVIEQNNTPENNQNNTSDNIKNNIIHNLTSLIFATFNNNNIADNEENADDNVGDQQVVHNFVGDAILMPAIKQIIDKNMPTVKVNKLKLSPTPPGTKIEIKVEPTNNLDISIKYSETFSNWSLDNFINVDSQVNNSKNENTLSSSRWTRVAELSEGDAIAVADLAELGKTSDGEEERSDGSSSDVEESFGSVKFVKIVRISILPPEQV
ncbi:MAG: hypothetical protein L6275_04555, partial [Candidatus Portnoybacteria bacterium]|nr:hypothetical protein [Candidatus Portnoybacteria bacterium]